MFTETCPPWPPRSSTPFAHGRPQGRGGTARSARVRSSPKAPSHPLRTPHRRPPARLAAAWQGRDAGSRNLRSSCPSAPGRAAVLRLFWDIRQRRATGEVCRGGDNIHMNTKQWEDGAFTRSSWSSGKTVACPAVPRCHGSVHLHDHRSWAKFSGSRTFAGLTTPFLLRHHHRHQGNRRDALWHLYFELQGDLDPKRKEVCILQGPGGPPAGPSL